MFGEFFSGVCHKENGENCSAEAVTDGRFKLLESNSSFGLSGSYVWIQIFARFQSAWDSSHVHPPIHPFLKGSCLQNPPKGIDPAQL